MGRGGRIEGGEGPLAGDAGWATAAGERGWRFFLWPGASSAGEERIGAEHPYARLIGHYESQIAERVSEAGCAPLTEIDVCFAHGAADEDGSAGINVDSRMQIVVNVDACEDPHHLVQVLCHEYCHALFTRAFFAAHGAGFGDEDGWIVDRRDRRDVVASEAIADAFAFTIHRRVEFSAGDLLGAEALRDASDYEQAYSLKRFLVRLIKQHRISSRADNFIYRALRARAARPDLNLFACLEKGLRDPEANPDGRSFEELYERVLGAELGASASA